MRNGLRRSNWVCRVGGSGNYVVSPNRAGESLVATHCNQISGRESLSGSIPMVYQRFVVDREGQIVGACARGKHPRSHDQIALAPDLYP
jgi:hypothetical protein